MQKDLSFLKTNNQSTS